MEKSSSHPPIWRRQFLSGLLALWMSACSTPSKVSEVIAPSQPPIDILRKMIEVTRVNYNGDLHDFPRDATILGPDNTWSYTVTSEKLEKVTRDMFQFDKNLNLITKEITIEVDEWDMLLKILLQKKFWLENGDICTVHLENNVLHILKKTKSSV